MKTKYWDFLENYNIDEIKYGLDDKQSDRMIKKIASENHKGIHMNLLNLPHADVIFTNCRDRYKRYRGLTYTLLFFLIIAAAFITYIIRNSGTIDISRYVVTISIVFILSVFFEFPLLIYSVYKTRRILFDYLKDIIFYGPGILDLPVPGHLKDIIIPLGKGNERTVTGEVICSCASNEMRLIVNAPPNCDSFPVKELKIVTYLSATCINCNKEYLIFDKNIHGWKGFINLEKTEGERSFAFVECPKCRCLSHSLYITVCSSGKEYFINESFLQKDDDTPLSGNDWVNAFSNFMAYAVCSNCGWNFPVVDSQTD